MNERRSAEEWAVIAIIIVLIIGSVLMYRFHKKPRATAGHRLDQEQVR